MTDQKAAEAANTMGGGEAKALVVPVRVTALRMNQGTRNTSTWARWLPNFAKGEHRSPEPRPPADSAHQFEPVTSVPNGVLLHWELPAALRTAAQDPVTGETTHPLVPNRWLVVRYSGPKGKRVAGAAWIVQSDRIRNPAECQDKGDDNSRFPGETATQSRRIGFKFDLAKGEWKEPANPPEPFLTAAGAGLVGFSLFQPYNLGVFSLHDPLDKTVTDGSRLSYQVIGWYSDPKSDPLDGVTGAESFAAALRALRWSVDGGTEHPARSLYSGALLDVVWHGTQPLAQSEDERPYKSPTANADPVTLALAETSAEGLCALLAHEAATKKTPLGTNDLRRFEAWLYGMLPQLDQHDGQATVKRLVHQARFEPVAAGYEWRIELPSAEPAAGGAPAIPAPVLTALTALNADEQACDDTRRALSRLRERAYQMWWAEQETDRAAADVDDDQDLKNELLKLAGAMAGQLKDKGPTLARTITDLRRQHGALAARIPRDERGNDTTRRIEEELAEAIPGARLRRVPRPPFFRPSEPVVLLRGAGGGRLVADGAVLPCRTTGMLGGTINGKKPPKDFPAPRNLTSLLQLPGLKPLAATLTCLLAEFALFDQEGASRVQSDGHAAVRFGTAAWKQPWTPLYVVWAATYHPIPFHSLGPERSLQENWTFERDRHRWTGQGHVADPDSPPREITLAGRLFLSAHAVWNVADRAEQSRTQFKSPPPWLDAIIKLTRKGDLLCQALDGFNEQLNALGAESHRRPPAEVAGLVHNDHGYHPRGLTFADDYDKDRPLLDYCALPPLEPLRAGQFRFTSLAVVDRFGRSFDVLPKNLGQFDGKPVRACSVLPDCREDRWVAVTARYASQYAHLTPRLPQPARLEAQVLTAVGDSPVPPYDTEPHVCAWIVPNHLDASLLVHAPDGTALGELNAPAGSVLWEDAVGGRDLPPREAYPHLHGFLTGLVGRAGGDLHALRRAIDAMRMTVNTTEPRPEQPGLRLLGRPLALVRARLALRPDGPPILPFTHDLAPAEGRPPEYLDYPWRVRLGNERSLHDGLVGYFPGDDYAAMHLVRTTVDNPYLVAAAPLEVTLAGPPAVATLLMDPWARVEAACHLVPTTELRLNLQQVAATAARLAPTFAVGPSLGTHRMVKPPEDDRSGEEPTAFPVPIPALEHGTWTWLQGDATLPVVAPDTTARLTPETPTRLRTGRLRLTDTFLP
ncbi:hypothetical protein AB0J52_07995 [Spirillospora sp. NPDC049652]